MKQHLIGLLIQLCVFSFGAMQSSSAASVVKESPLSRYFRVKGAPVVQGIEVVRVADGKKLFSYNAEDLLCPASISKLATTASLLYYFGPSHTLATRVFYLGKRQGSTIEGNLIIVGDGDPLMVSESLWQMAADLKNMGINKITGNLVLDNHLFDDKIRDVSRQDGVLASNHAYDAPVTAFGVNFNTLALAIAPGDKIGSQAKVNVDPYPVNGVVIDNRLKTVPLKQQSNVRVTRVSLADGRSKLVVSGQIARGSPLQKVYRSVNDPLVSSGEYVRAFLKGQGITIQGQTVAGSLPKGAQLILQRKSKPVSAIIRSLNLYSNNYIADVMVKRLGVAFPGRQTKEPNPLGTYRNGMNLIHAFLKGEVKWQGTYILKNGSGLNPENRVSAAQMAQLLAYMAKRWDLFPDYVASLPNAGLTGTLEKRFTTGPGLVLKGKVRAKTGTLSEPISVSTLAGYLYHEKHQVLAFAILQNGKAKHKQPSILDMQESQERGLINLLKHL